MRHNEQNENLIEADEEASAPRFLTSSPAHLHHPLTRSLLITLAALLLCAGLLALAGQNPLVAGQALVVGAVGTKVRLAESLAKTIPLAMTGLGVALAFRGGFWNIGAEGQFLMGALAATGLATKLNWPLWAVLIGGTILGAVWALIAGVLKTRRNAPEIITTIMLNYIALNIIEFCVRGPLQEAAHSQPQSDVLPARAQLPALLSGTTLHAGIFITLFCAFAAWWFLFRTERGFLLRASGAGPIAARASGIRVEREILFGVALSGALCGLGGAMEICGATKQLGLSGFGYGYTAIAVALLAGLHPLGVLPAALLFGLLSAGGGAMERSANIPAVAVSMVTGILICLSAALGRMRTREG
jgi:simple sugar transport system permease protein